MLAIAVLDGAIVTNIALGALYIVPVMLVAVLPQRWPVVLVSFLSTALLEEFGGYPWQPGVGTRFVIVFATFCIAGFIVGELVEKRREVSKNVERLSREMELRTAAELQSRVILETTPIGIVTIDALGIVLMANRSAERILVPPSGLKGLLIQKFLPSIGPALARQTGFRAEMDGTGYRANDESFSTHLWYSSYPSPAGMRAAVVFWDGSEQLRSQTEAGLEASMAASRIVLAGVSHEVRNLALGAKAAHLRFRDTVDRSGRADWDLVLSLLNALEKVGSASLRPAEAEMLPGIADLGSVLADVRVMIEPLFREIEAELRWDVDRAIPRVRFDHVSLVQVFLNLARNAQRILHNAPWRWVRVSSRVHTDRVAITMEDSGRGVENPEHLFQPFQSGAGATGLGLYISRGLLRSAGGDLRYERGEFGACFIVELKLAQIAGENGDSRGAVDSGAAG